MQTAPDRDDEAACIEALHTLDVLDSAPDPEFDALVHAAAALCEAPVSLISLVDSTRQWFKANIGLPGAKETPRAWSFCAYAVCGVEFFEVTDAAVDPRFADNPLVAGEPRIRFYAGAPISLSTGERVGALCVIDREPRRLQEHQRRVLAHLALAAAAALEGRRAQRLLKQALMQSERAAAALQHRESALKISETRFRTLSDGSPHGVFCADAQGAVSYTNARCQEIFGVTAEQCVASQWARFVHPHDRRYVLRAARLAAADHAEFSVQFRLLRPDGALRHVHVRGRTAASTAGTATDIVGSVEDVTARVTTAIALGKANERAALAIQSGGIGIWDWDIEAGTMTWDSRMYRLYGMTPRENFGNLALWTEMVHPFDRWSVERARTLAIDTGKPFAHEFRVVWPDGSVHHIEGAGQVTCDAAGRALRMVGSNRDITEARRLAGSLAEQHERLRVTLQSIGDAVITTDATGNIDWLNPVAQRLTGWSTQEAAGRPLPTVFRIIDEASRTPARTPVSEDVDPTGERRVPAGVLLISKDGIERGIEQSVAPMRDAQGNALGIVLVFRDITERKLADARLSYERTQLRTLLQTIPDMVWLKDPAGRYFTCNSAFERLLGCRAEDIAGKTDDDFVSPAAADAVRLNDREAVRHGSVTIEYWTNHKDDGRRVLLEITKTAMRDAEGRLLGIVSVGRDITVRRLAEVELSRHRDHLEELVQERTVALAAANAAAAAAHQASEERLRVEHLANMHSSKLKAVGTLAAGIAHDFNNILASIVGFAELTLDELSPASNANRNIAQILSAAFRARDLIGRMIDFARVSPVQPIAVDIAAEVGEALALLHASVPPSIEFFFHDGTEGASVILADPTQIMQIVMNLCINATHAIDGRGSISVSIDAARTIADTPPEYQDGICLTVTDSGTGMPPDVLERIFDPFFTTKAPGEGTGLGLSVVYGIVKALGGRVTVVSRVAPADAGTEFRVLLPSALHAPPDPCSTAAAVP